MNDIEINFDTYDMIWYDPGVEQSMINTEW